LTNKLTRYQAPHPPSKLVLDQPWALLANLSPTAFMQEYWHKRPLLVRGAIPSFGIAKQAGAALSSPISAQTLFEYACDGHSEARLVKAKPWQLIPGPFQKKGIPPLTQKDWTLLVQGVEVRHPAAAAVLSWFRFIPDARLDDLMISIAGLGGGVGPHVDSYDVFLIQMEGRRRWRISGQTDLSLRANLPLKILARFQPEQDWILEPGDLLYLPPNIAHEGIALDAGCQTWSVGFRAPTYRELMAEGLWRLAESLENRPDLDTIYADPKQEASTTPALLPQHLEHEILRRLQSVSLEQSPEFMNGITAYLSEPKPHALFTPPAKILSPNAFWAALQTRTLVPNPQTRMLQRGEVIFCNGEDVSQGQAALIQKAWLALAHDRAFTLGRTENSSKNKSLKKLSQFQSRMQATSPPSSHHSLYEAYCSGWLDLKKTAANPFVS